MTDDETDLEKAHAKVAGLERWLRARLLNGLTSLLLMLLIVGGLISALSPHFLLTLSICASVCVMIAVWMTVRTLLIIRELRTQPEHAVARLTKWRKVERAGFIPVK